MTPRELSDKIYLAIERDYQNKPDGLFRDIEALLTAALAEAELRGSGAENEKWKAHQTANDALAKAAAYEQAIKVVESKQRDWGGSIDEIRKLKNG